MQSQRLQQVTNFILLAYVLWMQKKNIAFEYEICSL